MTIKCWVSLLLASLTTPAWAVSTRNFRATSYADFDAGEAKGVVISSLGELTTGYATRRIDLPSAFVRCAVEDGHGGVYLGTGDKGEIWHYEQGKARKIVKIPDAVEVT